jgi:hypothetical protein
MKQCRRVSRFAHTNTKEEKKANNSSSSLENESIDWKIWRQRNQFSTRYQKLSSATKFPTSVKSRLLYDKLVYYGAAEIEINKDFYDKDPMKLLSNLQSDKGSAAKLFHHSKWHGYTYRIDKLPSYFWENIFTDDIREVIRLYFDSRKAALSQVEVIYTPKGRPMQNPHRDHDQGPLTSLCIAVASAADKKMRTQFILGSHITTEKQENVKRSRFVQFGDGGVNAVIFDPYIIHAGSMSELAEDDPRIFFTIEPSVEDEIKNLMSSATADKLKKFSKKHPVRKYARQKHNEKVKLLLYQDSMIKEVQNSYRVEDLVGAKIIVIDELLKKEKEETPAVL